MTFIMLTIAIVTPNFTLAGVPIAQFRLANLLATRGHKVDLIVGKIHTYPVPPLVSGVRLVHLNAARVRGFVVPLAKLLRKHRYDVVFSAEDHLTIIMVVAKKLSRFDGKLVCSSRVTPHDVYGGSVLSKGWCLRYLYRWAMGHVDVLTCVAKEMVSQYYDCFGPTRHIAIYNPVFADNLLAQASVYVEHEWFNPPKIHKVLISIGRLSPWKGHADLLEAFHVVRKQCSVKLIIIGDGELRDFLEDLTKRLRIEEDVCFMGYLSNPLSYLKRSDIFVLSSHVEGMPNVLVEAMALGRQVVSTDCDTGPREIIQSGTNGYLAKTGSIDSLAEAIMCSIRMPLDPEVIQRSVSCFKPHMILKKYSALLGLEL